MVQAYSESYSEEDRAWLNQLSQNLSIYTPTPEEEQNLRQRIYMIASTHKWNKDVSQDSDPALGLNQLSENFSVYTPTPEVEQNLRDRITLLAATNKWDKDVSRDSGAALPGLTQSKTAARNPARKLCYSSDDGV